ncbi:uncharacterized protein LOC131253077 [Magnolia sinica]|uniref:uncharacterized protein LOC131253077 n=1 Tax=Magnolia sinica TaxID=86752 RepID=UPI00265950B6|nr:uncharacterized protein LOC131253077 [Magnolia sinica]
MIIPMEIKKKNRRREKRTLFLQSKITPDLYPKTSLHQKSDTLALPTQDSGHTHIGKMASSCISSCVDAHAPVRATYVNLYKWPESDAEFVRSVTRGSARGAHSHQHHHHHNHPRVVDSYSCRQMYLRSYTFSRKETVHERTTKCFGRVRKKVVSQAKKEKNRSGRKFVGMRKVGEISCAALCSIFHRLLSCTTSVDVVDR